MPVDALAAAILAACGGPANVTAAEQCFTRLRLEVRTLASVDFEALRALPEVRLALEQGDEVQLVLSVDLSTVVADLSSLLS